MFRHLFKYGFKSLLRTKEVMFWTLIFPFALCTFMYLAFGKIFDTTEKFQAVPVAVVVDQENEMFMKMLQIVSAEGDNQLIIEKRTDKEEAGKLLKAEKVSGIIYVGDTVSLEVGKSGVAQTMLKMFLDQFLQYEKTVTDVGNIRPEKIMPTLFTLTSGGDYFSEKTDMKGNQDNVINYFYAIFAMVCLFACYSGCGKIVNIQANTSNLGQRRNVSPTHKIKTIIAEFLACEFIQFAIVCLLLIYMKVVLKLEIGDNIPMILLILFIGTSYGVLFGMFVGALPRIGLGAKIGILTAVSLALCAMSDLMAQGVRDLIEHHVPVINDINPAALITDSFYALNVYDTYERVTGNLLLLGGGAVVWGIVCYFMIRRSRYASL